MTESPRTHCPDDETLAAWVDGRLSRAQSAPLVEHVSLCPFCIERIEAANETFHAEKSAAGVVRPGGTKWWLLAAAAVLMVVLPAIVFDRSRPRDPLQELVEVAPRSARASEARLSGGFAWAPYRGSMRAGGTAAGTDHMKLIGVAAEALENAQRDPSQPAQRAAGVAMVLIERPEEGIPLLAAQAKQSTNDARPWSDLAAAQYAAALRGRTSLYPEALASVNRALRIDARMREALFNRALILERLGLHGEARAAWQRYLEEDASSPWAAEAREHLARLGRDGGAARFDADREQLEVAAAAGDASLVRTLVDRHRERARAFGEAEYLGRWAEALQRGDSVAAAKWLAVSRNIGAALTDLSGESLLRDAVRVIDTSSAAQRERIASAHLIYRRGRIAFSRREPGAAERDLREAAQQFASARSAMAFAARSYAAGARLAQSDVVTARSELSALLAEVDAARGYLSLAGQVRWELARALMLDGDASGAARMLAEAVDRFRRGGESVNQATVGNMLAEALVLVGQPDEAWLAHAAAFRTFERAGRIDLLDAAIGGAATTVLRAGRRETARALVEISESLERGMSNDLLLADTLVRKSLLEADAAAALRSAEEAVSVATRIPDGALRARHLADADMAMAAALVAPDAKRAHALASRAVELYTTTGMTVLLAEPYLIRARASMRLGNIAAAESDLAAGIAAVEQHRMRIADAVIGTGVLDAGNALFEEAIRADLTRGDLAAAFAHAERRRGIAATAQSLGELRARLAGSGTAVVTVIALPDEVVTLTVTDRGATAARHAIARPDLDALAARADDAACTRLYDLLMRPAAMSLRDARALIVVADELLERVPFAALHDAATGRMLIEQMQVAMAPSAAELRTTAQTPTPATIAAISLPSGNGSESLPEADLELTEIARFYRAMRRVSARAVTAHAIEEHAAAADVLHIAGHTEGDAGSAGESLAIPGGSISWRTIAAMDAVPPVVVLSACNTLRRPAEADRRALSLGGAFVAAGAREVVGTLAPIGDAEARSLFTALHEQLARGVAAPAALRHVQLAQLRRPGGAWRHLALLTTSIRRNI
jgi:CHAT domain-containing protein